METNTSSGRSGIQHRLHRSDLLHELAIPRRGGLQGGVGLCLLLFGGGDAAGQIRGVDAWSDLPRSLLGKFGALAIEVGEVLYRVLLLADRRGDGGIACAFQKACAGLGDLLAGDTALRQLRRDEHLALQRLRLFRPACGLGGEGVQARHEHLAVGPDQKLAHQPQRVATDRQGCR